MHPVLFEIPGTSFEIPSFGVLVAAGFLLGLWLWGRNLARYGDDPERDPARGSEIAVWVLIGVIGGARLFYVGVETARYLTADVTPDVQRYLEAENRYAVARTLAPDELERAREVAQGHDYLRDPLSILFVWRGGLVMYGGFLGAVLLGIWGARRKGLDPWNAFDTGVVAGFGGQAVGRWGCLLVGDDYGSVVPEGLRHLPFPITFRVPDAGWLRAHPKSLFPEELAGEVIWATQVWMSANALVLALLGWAILRRRRYVGQVAGWAIVYYAVTRFAIEAFRGDAVRGVWFGGALSTSQILALPGLLIGVWILVHRKRRGRAPPPRAPRPAGQT